MRKVTVTLTRTEQVSYTFDVANELTDLQAQAAAMDRALNMRPAEQGWHISKVEVQNV